MNLQPNFKTEIINKSQTAFNIAYQLKRAIKESANDAKKIASAFNGTDNRDIASNLFYWSKKNLPYKKEGSENQSAKTLARLLYDRRKGNDCKHYAVFSASLCRALSIPVKLRLISQNFYDKTPTHIYVVATGEDGQEIIIDPCMMLFNDEARFNYKYDINI
jgi:transglutaminase-like putative cysteine protease